MASEKANGWSSIPLLQLANSHRRKKQLKPKFFSRSRPLGRLWTGANRKPDMSKKAKPTPLTKLLKAWTGASPEERQAFLDLVTAEVRARGEPALSATAKPPESLTPESLAPDPVTADQETLIANGRYLLPSTIARVEAVMRARSLSPTSVMAELGFSPRDTSLTRALAMKAALRLSVIAELTLWLRANEAAATRQG